MEDIESRANPDLNGEDHDAAPQRLPMPDVGDFLFLGVLYILLVARPDFLFQDGSTGWHLYTGKWIFENQAIPRTDLLSNSFADKPWVAYEWLFDLTAYLITLAGGLNLLAVVISALIAFVLMKMYDRCREEGAPLQIAFPLATIGIFASAIHWLARPHIMTFVGVFIFITHLEDYYRQKKSSTSVFIILGGTMLIWANSHPAFILGLALIVLYTGCAMLSAKVEQNDSMAETKRKQARTLALVFLSTSLITLINPYGFGLHLYILHYLQGNSILAETDEFKSPVFHDNIHALCLELMLIAIVAGLAITKRRVLLPTTATVITLLHLALSAVRNIPLFSLAAVPFAGGLFAETRIPSASSNTAENTHGFRKSLSEFDKQEMQCKMRILPIAAVCTALAVALSGGQLLGMKLQCGFNNQDKPTKTLAFIKEHSLPADDGFNLDNWGGLINYKLGRRVFIDDRSDFYGEEYYKRYGIIVQTEPGWDKLLSDLNVKWVIMPRESKLAKALAVKANWTVACEDPASLLLIRKDLEVTN